MSTLKLPRISPIPDERDEWVLLEGYEFKLPDEFGGEYLYLPQGLRSDLASVPGIFWQIMAPHQLSGLAPYLHDMLYRCKGQPPRFIAPERVSLSRKEVDRLFLWVMKEAGVHPFRRSLAYRGVRLGGKGAWGAATIEVDVPLAEGMLSCEDPDDIGWSEP